MDLYQALQRSRKPRASAKGTKTMGFLVDLLTGISPWWWVALAMGLIAVEMLTLSFFLIWPALSALVVALTLSAVPNLSAPWQMLLFACFALIFTLLGRSVIYASGDGADGPDHQINRRSDQLIGRQARVIRFAAGEGTVEIDGIPWRAVSEAPNAPSTGDTVRITGCAGTLLHVAGEA